MDVKKWFYDNTDTLYKNAHVPDWLKAILSIVFTLVFGGIIYKLIANHFHDPVFDSHLDDLQLYLKLEKKI